MAKPLTTLGDPLAAVCARFICEWLSFFATAILSSLIITVTTKRSHFLMSHEKQNRFFVMISSFFGGLVGSIIFLLRIPQNLRYICSADWGATSACASAAGAGLFAVCDGHGGGMTVAAMDVCFLF